MEKDHIKRLEAWYDNLPPQKKQGDKLDSIERLTWIATVRSMIPGTAF